MGSDTDNGHDLHAATIVRLRSIEDLQRMADTHRRMADKTDKSKFPETYKLECQIALCYDHMIGFLQAE
jgi:hypothetical protein